MSLWVDRGWIATIGFCESAAQMGLRCLGRLMPQLGRQFLPPETARASCCMCRMLARFVKIFPLVSLGRSFEHQTHSETITFDLKCMITCCRFLSICLCCGRSPSAIAIGHHLVDRKTFYCMSILTAFCNLDDGRTLQFANGQIRCQGDS